MSGCFGQLDLVPLRSLVRTPTRSLAGDARRFRSAKTLAFHQFHRKCLGTSSSEKAHCSGARDTSGGVKTAQNVREFERMSDRFLQRKSANQHQKEKISERAVIYKPREHQRHSKNANHTEIRLNSAGWLKLFIWCTGPMRVPVSVSLLLGDSETTCFRFYMIAHYRSNTRYLELDQEVMERRNTSNDIQRYTRDGFVRHRRNYLSSAVRGRKTLDRTAASKLFVISCLFAYGMHDVAPSDLSYVEQ